ncbi:DUF2617 family protein [Gordonia pseudamarae]|jgi:hypothetical protein|uniref:DUF2617 family protein n=1 Tax=Gordonia pseudamarae TaxID=2831662 RepID=A0ABX6ILR8_9ACTN|nr:MULTISPECIES: DUF2617 family protein [Gordonia]MBD0021884.1 DUF2617 family protein [Gordonia sp. (in: high G+C Gram-positive bacteria)]QHN27994.1 DUF2617 family protein [Gordonia pseudamarae]QHN36852.1 DUF2617 family protein [Gordonia pseudamarae]
MVATVAPGPGYFPGPPATPADPATSLSPRSPSAAGAPASPTELPVAHSGTSASARGISLSVPVQQPPARVDGEVAGLPVSRRLLHTGHQVLVGRSAQLLETVARLPGVTSELPSPFQESGYYFSARTDTLDADTLNADAPRLSPGASPG